MFGTTNLVEPSILIALEYWMIATPLEIGDTIGADKFLVLKILRQMERSNRVRCVGSFPSTPPSTASEEADRRLFEVTGGDLYESVRTSQ